MTQHEKRINHPYICVMPPSTKSSIPLTHRIFNICIVVMGESFEEKDKAVNLMMSNALRL
jgi:hypothetical protein